VGSPEFRIKTQGKLIKGTCSQKVEEGKTPAEHTAVIPKSGRKWIRIPDVILECNKGLKL
jgi:hypothetical protein